MDTAKCPCFFSGREQNTRSRWKNSTEKFPGKGARGRDQENKKIYLIEGPAGAVGAGPEEALEKVPRRVGEVLRWT